MKTFYQLFLLTGYSVINAFCQKKNNIVVNYNAENISEKFQNKIANNSLTTLKISTIAGVASHIGYVDGVAKEALFYNPIGIDLAPNGFLYVADTYNDKIRKISLFDNQVTTVSIANANDGASISGPYVLRVSQDGTINVIANEPHAVWIIKPGGQVLTPNPIFHNGRNGIGFNAHIFVVKLTLSNDENTRYFTDSYYHTIQKMQLN